MATSYKTLYDKIIWLLTVALFVIFVLFETYTAGRYFYLGITLLILFLSIARNNGGLLLRIDPFHLYSGMFIFYVLFSSAWAMSAEDSISMSITLFLILICSSVLYMHYIRLGSLQSLFSAIKWAGYFVAIYTIFYYGIDVIIEAFTSVRLQNSFANVNSISMFVAIACTIQASEFIHKKSRAAALFIIPCIIVISATQSKKALLALLLGFLGIYLFNRVNKKNIFKSLGVIIFASLALILLFYIISTFSVFSGMNERIQQLFNSITGEGEVDESTIQRNDMIALGWNWFKQYPIAGVGIGCPHILADRYLNMDAYLHNNYLELLCGGGLIGFLIYYFKYVYLIRNLLKYRHADKEFANLSILILLISLVLDWGFVSYFDKLQNYYFVVFFLSVQYLKGKAKANINENLKTV